MNSVSQWAAGLCVAAVGCTALQMLAPKGGLGKLFRLIIAAFFLCCMASPLLSLKDIRGLSIGSTGNLRRRSPPHWSRRRGRR